MEECVWCIGAITSSQINSPANPSLFCCWEKNGCKMKFHACGLETWHHCHAMIFSSQSIDGGWLRKAFEYYFNNAKVIVFSTTLKKAGYITELRKIGGITQSSIVQQSKNLENSWDTTMKLLPPLEENRFTLTDVGLAPHACTCDCQDHSKICLSLHWLSPAAGMYLVYQEVTDRELCKDVGLMMCTCHKGVSPQ